MSVPSLALAPPRGAVLADPFAGTWLRDAALVCAGALLTVLGAQVSIHVPPSPVPVTGQTFAVVVAGSVLGARRGAASQLLYLLLGLALPVYADGASGSHVVFGATGGYLIGFVIAAWVVGRLAELGADRRPPVALLAFCLGQLVIFGIGVPWLKVSTDMAWSDAFHDGFAIFVVGGLVKAVAAAAVTGAAWRVAPPRGGGGLTPPAARAGCARRPSLGSRATSAPARCGRRTRRSGRRRR